MGLMGTTLPDDLSIATTVSVGRVKPVRPSRRRPRVPMNGTTLPGTRALTPSEVTTFMSAKIASSRSTNRYISRSERSVRTSVRMSGVLMIAIVPL